MMRSNTADNCNFMDNMFRTYISTKPSVLPSYSAFCGEQHWRNAL
ncbi:protein YdgV [Kluyvera cryocrescens]